MTSLDFHYLTIEESAKLLSVDTKEVLDMVKRGELPLYPISDGQERIPRIALQNKHLTFSSRALMVFDDTPAQVAPKLRTYAQKETDFKKRTGRTPNQYLKDFHAGLLDLLEQDVATRAIEAEELIAERKYKSVR